MSGPTGQPLVVLSQYPVLVEHLHPLLVKLVVLRLALVGAPNCGKSTLLYLLGGLDRPTVGEVTVVGRRMDALSESARAVLRRETVGFVFQMFYLVPYLNVIENVVLAGRAAGKNNRTIKYFLAYIFICSLIAPVLLAARKFKKYGGFVVFFVVPDKFCIFQIQHLDQ